MTEYTIAFTDNDKGSPALKLADAEIVFTAGPLAGLRLIGFALWERSAKNPARYVTFPARTYSVNGERRSFALLRPQATQAGIDAHDAIAARILDAYKAHERARAEAVTT